MICTVSTVRDSAENVSRFVDRNLAAGVDHMFVFLDGSHEEVAAPLALLREHQDVSAIHAGPGYWQGRRPAGLNKRQVVNATLVNTLLAPFPQVRWLFHIDGDECVDIDRGELLDPGNEARCIRLQPLEAVSQERWDGEVDLFKRKLDEDELALLTILGVIPRPTNSAYFNGHLLGKPGLLPDLDYRLTIHKVVDYTAAELEPEHIPAQHVLHYESFSSQEFVRKWFAHLSSGTRPTFSASRNQIRAAVAAILSNRKLEDREKRQLLEELYRRRVQDDLPVLQRLGYLVTPDPARHRHQPVRWQPDEKELMRLLLRKLCVADKQAFMHNGDIQPIRLLPQLADQDGPRGVLLERIRTCLRNHERRRARWARRVTPSHDSEPQARVDH
jgi:hypothetical protein